MSNLIKSKLLRLTGIDKKCCSWPKIALFFMVLSVTFVMLFFLIPVNSIARKIIPDIESYKKSTTNSSEASFPSSTPSFAPSFAPSSFVSKEVIMTHDGNSSVSSPQIMNSPTISPTTEITADCLQGKMCCNGLVSNCNLRLDEVMYPTLHNAMDTKEGGSIEVQNHLYPLETAVDAGFRGIHLHVCECNGVLQFCHGVCDFAFRDPVDVFSNINDFLSLNQFEIIIFVFEMSVGDIKFDKFYDLMKKVEGFTEKMYAHEDSTKSWPKMSELLSAGKQIVAFEHGKVKKECKQEACRNVLHKYWDYSMETDHQFKVANDLLDYEKSCIITRGLEGSKSFFNINNFVIPPDQQIAALINAKLFLGSRIVNCSSKNFILPNLIYVDYWSMGDTVDVTIEANKQFAASLKSKIGTIRG